jgi:hypothetical protein
MSLALPYKAILREETEIELLIRLHHIGLDRSRMKFC